MCYFFFQAEDGIRDIGVTGVQTCALPISTFIGAYVESLGLFGITDGWWVYLVVYALFIGIHLMGVGEALKAMFAVTVVALAGLVRSEERRVGKECRSRWSPYH